MRRILSVSTLLVLLVLNATAASTNKLEWKQTKNLVNADIRSWNLQTLLERIALSTGWEILVEPGTTRDVSVKFTNLTVDSALPRLLGPLNYALVPQTNAAPRLLVFKTNRTRATEAVKIGKRDLSDIMDEYDIRTQFIVTLSPSSSLTIEQLAKSLGAKIVGRSDALRTYLLEFPSESAARAAREQLQDNPNVSSFEPNKRIDPPPPSFNAPALSRNFNLKPVSTADAKNPIVALIDTGIQNLDPTKAQFLLPAISLVEGKPAPGELTHGTSMANALLDGMATALKDGESPWKILPIDVYGGNESATTFHVALGIYEAVNGGASVINLSLGTPAESAMVQRVIASAHEQGVIFLAAAGNIPTDAPTYPAAYNQVTAVTAGDRDGNLASYANYGEFVDVIGPGGTIVRINGRSFFVGGTSVATAWMSGLAAGIVTATGQPVTKAVGFIQSEYGFGSRQK